MEGMGKRPVMSPKTGEGSPEDVIAVAKLSLLLTLIERWLAAANGCKWLPESAEDARECWPGRKRAARELTGEGATIEIRGSLNVKLFAVVLAVGEGGLAGARRSTHIDQVLLDFSDVASGSDR